MMLSNLVREISLRFIDHPVWTVDGQLLIASDVSLTVNAEVLTTQYHTSHTDRHSRWTAVDRQWTVTCLSRWMPRSWQHSTTLHTQTDTVDGQLLIASDVSLTVNAEVLTTHYHASHTDRHSWHKLTRHLALMNLADADIQVKQTMNNEQSCSSLSL